MNAISVEACTVKFNDSFSLYDIDWCLKPGEHWAILGPNGAGKSALAALLAGEGKIESGVVQNLPKNVQIVSFETQAALIERERAREMRGVIDGPFLGTTVAELLAEGDVDPAYLADLISKFKLEGFLARRFRSLSTGETRKILLIAALASRAELLILDEPFDGLDVASVELLNTFLGSIKDSLNMVMVLNRFDEIPDFADHFLYMDSGRIQFSGNKDDEAALSGLEQLLHLKTTNLALPDTDPADTIQTLNPDAPLLRMNKARVAYGDNIVFEGLDWQVEPNQHWQVSGPNGSGKTCLLNLITGDHPQCYTNDLLVFGYQRGQGESIWQIKQHIGYVSTALQWEYRVSTNLLNVILSGFYDSIGLYETPSEAQTLIANQWLQLLGMAHRWDQAFKQLSYGEQRMLLIARAMVKQPPMLILDEPCLGLDDLNRHLVLALIEKICLNSTSALRQTAVIYVNHHAEDKISGIDHYLHLTGKLLTGKQSDNNERT